MLCVVLVAPLRLCACVLSKLLMAGKLRRFMPVLGQLPKMPSLGLRPCQPTPHRLPQMHFQKLHAWASCPPYFSWPAQAHCSTRLTSTLQCCALKCVCPAGQHPPCLLVRAAH